MARSLSGLGIESKFRAVVKDMGNLYRRSGGEWLRSVTYMDPYQLPDPNINFDWWEFNAKEREFGLQVLAEIALMPPERINALDETTVKEYFEQYEAVPPRLYGYFAFLTHAFNVGLIDLVPMSEVVKAFQRLMGQPLGYPRGGYGRMSEDFAQVVKDCGSEIKTRTRVERILIEDGRAAGVITRDAVYRAPIVVSNAGLQPTVLKLVGEQHFDKSYVSYVKGLLPSNGFTGAHWVLSEPVLDCGLYQVWSDDAWWDLDRQDEVKKGKMPADLIITVLVPTNYDPEMGPPGKQLLIFGTPCSSNPADKTIEALWKKTDRADGGDVPRDSAGHRIERAVCRPGPGIGSEPRPGPAGAGRRGLRAVRHHRAVRQVQAFGQIPHRRAVLRRLRRRQHGVHGLAAGGGFRPESGAPGVSLPPGEEAVGFILKSCR